MNTTQNTIAFRGEEPPVPAVTDVKAPEIPDAGNLDRATTEQPELGKTTPLEKWEIENGKYGVEYLGIKEISKEWPVKMQFPYIDNFIKSEIKARGMDATPEAWQDILREIEDEIGTEKTKTYSRIERVYRYIQTLQKYREAKAKKDAFRITYP